MIYVTRDSLHHYLEGIDVIEVKDGISYCNLVMGS
jgi:hypothetical protein